MENYIEKWRQKMFHKIKDYWELIRITIVKLTICLLFWKKSRPIALKYLEMKLNIITQQEFEAWIMADAVEL